MKTFRYEFLGCKVNQYDAESARRLLLERGFEETEEGAALLLLASCTVTGTAAGKGRQAMRAMLRRHPGAHVAVLGCFTEDDRRLYEELAPSVTFLPSARNDGFLDALEPLVGKTTAATSAHCYRPRRTRAYLKVEDGCDLSCSFCIIPSVRGRARSRDPAEIEREVRDLVEAGTREVVLTGVHLGHYGRRIQADLPTLLRRLLAIEGDWRLRLSSLEVSELSEELLDLLAGHPRLVPHLHLPLQSGSNRILLAMRRPYDAELFRAQVARLRQRLDHPALTTDVIVGFPGESDADFAATLALVREAAFSKLHVFPFSVRRGTRAESLPDHVPGAVIKARKSRLFELERTLKQGARQQQLGREVRVVVENVTPAGEAIGMDERYHRTRIHAAANARVGDLVRAHVTGVDEHGLLARLVTTAPDRLAS